MRYLLLLQKDVARAAKFYHEGLGLPLKVLTDNWAELSSGSTTIALKAADGEAFCSVGYTPIMAFDVADLQATLTRMLHLGAHMDGAIQYLPEGGKVAALRAPDGHMVSIIEKAEGA